MTRKLTATIITKNEESNIERCVRALAFADEVLVLDSGSTDRTVEIARSLGARVEVTDWPGHVKQKQRAVDRATHDTILAIDADEVVTDELRASIQRVLNASDLAAGYELTRKTFYLGRWIEHCGWYPEWRVRLFDRRRARWTGFDPHDRVACDGKPGRLAGDLLHYSYRDIAHHLTRINEYTTTMAHEHRAAGKHARVRDVLIRPWWNFLKKYFLQRGFLDGVPGLIVCVLAAYYVFLKYAKLWELSRRDA
ncbi:glycosyltransferase family 2 protein [bacterium]|nr:glycosyltransferase family 2 protein [bacterium]